MDEIVSKLYVNKCFDNNSKENVKNIIKEIIEDRLRKKGFKTETKDYM